MPGYCKNVLDLLHFERSYIALQRSTQLRISAPVERSRDVDIKVRGHQSTAKARGQS